MAVKAETGREKAPREAGLELLSNGERSMEVRDGKLFVSAWVNGGYSHHVKFDLSNPSDGRVSLDDLEGVFVDVVDVEA